MGKIVYIPESTPPTNHQHEKPPSAEDYPLGTVWACSCGFLQCRLEVPTHKAAQDGGRFGMWVDLMVRDYI